MTIQPSDKVLSIRQTAAVMNLSVRVPSSVSARAVPDHGKSCFPPAVWASASAMWLHGSMDGLSARRALDRVRTNGSSGVELPYILHSDFDSLDGPSRPTRAPMDRADQPVKITVQRY